MKQNYVISIYGSKRSQLALTFRDDETMIALHTYVSHNYKFENTIIKFDEKECWSEDHEDLTFINADKTMFKMLGVEMIEFSKGLFNYMTVTDEPSYYVNRGFTSLIPNLKHFYEDTILYAEGKINRPSQVKGGFYYRDSDTTALYFCAWGTIVILTRYIIDHNGLIDFAKPREYVYISANDDTFKLFSEKLGNANPERLFIELARNFDERYGLGEYSKWIVKDYPIKMEDE